MNIDPKFVAFFRIRDRKKFPVTTVAYTPVVSPSGYFVAFSVATHNPKDPYVYEVGRIYSRDRLLNQECMVVVGGVGWQARVIDRIARNRHLPSRTQAAASYWLWREANRNASKRAYSLTTAVSFRSYPHVIHDVKKPVSFIREMLKGYGWGV